MAETLRNRVSQIVMGGTHALLDAIEDQAPEAMMEQAIRKVDGVIDEVRAELGQAAANRHLAQRQHADLNQRHLDLTVQAEQALALNRDDLARAAVTRQLDIEAQIPIVEGTLSELAAKEKELSGFVDALLGKRRDMSLALEQFAASRSRAASPSGITPATSHAQTSAEKASEAFNRVFQRQTGLPAGDHKISVIQDSQLKELENLMQNQKVEARIAQLKAAKS